MTGNETPLQVFSRLMLFTLLMIFIPFSTYFGSKYYVFEGMLLYPSHSSCVYAAVCAVISVNVVIAAYVYVAWHSEQPNAQRTTHAAAAAAGVKLD